MTPQILTSTAQDDFLSEEAQNTDQLELMIVRAENKTLDRYRETRPEGRFQIEGIDGEPLEEDVQLDGWVEGDDGDPNLNEIDSDLLFALRDVVARIVEFWVDQPDEAEHIERMDQGDRRVDFRDKDLPASVFQPLRRFDQRSVWHG